MPKRDAADITSGPTAASDALTVEKVQRMIDAALIRHDVIHGHLAPSDGDAALADLADDDSND